MKTYLTIFLVTFLAEMGDKTQISTLLFSANSGMNRWGVLTAASCALVMATFLAVIVGAELDKFVSSKTIKIASGTGFIVLGLWSLFTAK